MLRFLKRFRLCLVAGALMLISATVLMFILPHERRGRADYSKIEAGMSKEKVEAILGGPPKDYENIYQTRNWLLKGGFDLRQSVLAGPADGTTVFFIEGRWQFDDGFALVYWGPDEKVVGKIWQRRGPPSLTEKIRHFLRKIGL